jgi:hypothetical protein
MKRISFPSYTPNESRGSRVRAPWRDIGRGVAAGAGFAFLCTVLLALAIERGARDLPTSPRSFLIWYWTAGLAGGAVWGALRQRRTHLGGYLASGAVVGAVVVSPLSVLIPLDEPASFSFGMLVMAAVAGAPAGALLGLLLWLRRAPR